MEYYIFLEEKCHSNSLKAYLIHGIEKLKANLQFFFFFFFCGSEKNQLS